MFSNWTIFFNIKNKSIFLFFCRTQFSSYCDGNKQDIVKNWKLNKPRSLKKQSYVKNKNTCWLFFCLVKFITITWKSKLVVEKIVNFMWNTINTKYISSAYCKKSLSTRLMDLNLEVRSCEFRRYLSMPKLINLISVCIDKYHRNSQLHTSRFKSFESVLGDFLK